MENKSIKIALIILAILAIGVALKILSFLILPLAMSLFIAALLVPLFNQMKIWRIPHVLAVILVFAAFGGIMRGAVGIIQLTEREYLSKKDEINQLAQEKLHPAFESAENYIGVDLAKDFDWSQLSEFLASSKIVDSVSPIVGMFNSLVGFYLMTIIYLIIMLSGIYKYNDFLMKVGGADFKKMVNNWIDDLKVYIKVKSIVSLMTGTLFGTICYLFNVDFALSFGVLAFILNFIPNIGSIIATIFPVLLGFLEIDSLAVATTFAVILGATQFLMGNVIEVKYIGKSFSIHTIIVFLNLIFWGYLWGVSGIILSVPIIVFIKNWALYYQKDKVVAKLLSN